MTDIKVPTIGESISEVTLLQWIKKDGEYVDRDEVIAELESEKATFEVNAEKAGVLKTSAHEGDTLKIGDLLASIDETAAKPGKADKKETTVDSSSNGKRPSGKKEEERKEPEKKENEKVEGLKHPVIIQPDATDVSKEVKASPVASAMIADKKIKVSSISPSGVGGKILKDDVLAALSDPGKITGGKPLFSREEKREKMSQLRKTISRSPMPRARSVRT